MAAKDEEVWPSPALKQKIPPDLATSIPFSDFTKSGVEPFSDVVGPIYDEINELYGTDYEPFFKD
jgi:hypothetical protein